MCMEQRVGFQEEDLFPMCMSLLASKVPPVPESPGLTALGSLGSLLLVINKGAVVQCCLPVPREQPACLPSTQKGTGTMLWPSQSSSERFNCCNTHGGLTSGTAEAWKIT